MHDNGVIFLQYASGFAMKNTSSKANVSYFRQGNGKSQSNDSIQSEPSQVFAVWCQESSGSANASDAEGPQIGHLLIHCSKNGCKLFCTKKKNVLGLFNGLFVCLFCFVFRVAAKTPILGCNTSKKKAAIPLRDRVLSSNKTQITYFWCLLHFTHLHRNLTQFWLRHSLRSKIFIQIWTNHFVLITIECRVGCSSFNALRAHEKPNITCECTHSLLQISWLR